MRTLACVVVMAFSGSALAEPIPKIDVDGLCRKAFDRRTVDLGPAQEHYTKCFDEAQISYDKLKRIWSTISEDQQKKCVRDNVYTRATLYSFLVSCVETTQAQRAREMREAEEAEARRQIPKREFRY